MQECPSEEHLAAYAEGICSKGDTERIGAHVEQCARCAQWVAQAKSGADQVREMAKKDSTAPESTTAWKGRHPVAVPAAAATASMATLPQTIQGYEVVRELHRGGQGVVYQAVQTSTKRKVAIKVLLEGPYASKPARKRFEREIELVAQLRHPHIISIFDSGTTADGLQFYVMDYVRGARLNHYVREEKPTLEETLQLFEAICRAVQFAHQRGIIHRDLKPSNILVDSEVHPKLLDFGLAKWMAAPQRTIVTMSEQVVGTLPYLSPEQARGNPEQIDTRTDIYALGVILYEILTGHYPYPVTGQMADVLKHIAETAPTPPSRAWTSDSGVTRRSTKYLRAGKCPIDDELQTIILKALSKERERRYQSAGELAKDIGHYLADEPIDAKRDSGWYVVRKTLRRHRVPAAIAALFVLLVTASAIGLSVLYSRAAEQRAVAQAVIDFLNKDLLAMVAPEEQGRDVTMLQVLNAAAARIGEKFENQPLAEATIRTTLGTTYVSLGEYGAAKVHVDRGLELHRRHLGENHRLTLESMIAVARLHEGLAEYDDAEKLYVRVLETRESVLGKEHETTLEAVNHLARLLFRQEQLDEAEILFKRALEVRRRILGPDHEDTLVSMSNLASVYWQRGRFPDAEELYLEAWETSKRGLGESHSRTIMLMANLGILYWQIERYDEAERYLLSAIEDSEGVLGAKHPHRLNYMFQLARVYEAQGRYEDALRLDLQAWEGRRDVLPENHPDTIRSQLSVAGLHYLLGDHDKARSNYLEVEELAKRSLGDEDPLTLMAMRGLGEVCTTLERYDEAESRLLKANKILKRMDDNALAGAIDVPTALCRLYEAWGKPEEAVQYCAKGGDEEP